MSSTPPAAPLPRPVVWLALAVALLILLGRLGDWAVDYLWLDGLGYAEVFWRLRLLRVGLFVAAFALLLVYFAVNLELLARAPVRPGARFVPLAGQRWLRLAAAVAGALVFALALGAQWDDLLRLLWSQPFGEADPLFGRDLGFYLLELPFLGALQSTLALAALLATAVLVFGHGDAGTLEFDWERGVRAAPGVRRQLGVNLALFLAAAAWGFWLDRYGLLQSAEGAVHGAGYTEVHVTLPALDLLCALTALAALAALLPQVQRSGRLLLGIALAYLAVLFAGLVLLPWAVQSFVVEPSELERETPYLRRNIELTRRAFGIDEVQARAYDAVHELGGSDLAANRETLRNVRLWDWGPLLRTFRQLQQIRSYYEFNHVDVDRYRIGGAYRQVLLSARELSGQLPARADTWLNRRLQFTHGYGLAMSLAAEKTGEGSPELVIRDLPPQASPGVDVSRPAVYYGESMEGYRIVATEVKEFDYPRGDANVYTRYAGHGGVRVDSSWRRLLFAWYTLDANILLSGYIRDGSRIQLRREVADRVRHIAPFLRLDEDPYLVVSEGRLYWIQDAYTTSDSFPYSEPDAAGYNYIRNSVKVVVDAYDGDATFYVMDPDDPVLGAYRAALPELFRPLSDLPRDLRSHLRYPLELFKAQLEKYNRYHMTSPQVFYNAEDLWVAPAEKYGGERVRMEPYYVLMRLPGEERLEFLLMSPLTPRNRDNMIAWMTARSDFPGYGKLVVYKLPKEHLVLGPMQIEAMIDQDTLISQQLSLWDQRGSRVIRGNLLVIPVDRSFIYVEPVYLTAEGTDIPQLKRVIVSDGARLAMEPTLAQSLQVVFGGAPRAPQREAGAAAPAPPEAARAALEAAREALGRGDWEGFAGAMRKLEKALAP